MDESIVIKNSQSNKVAFLYFLPTVITVTGCSRAPLQDVMGSFFPSWMLCCTLGAIASAFLRLLLGFAGIQQTVAFPFLTYLAFTFVVTSLTWLFVFG
ncbi:hypothetical protein J2D73_18925 [Acetobacter sacchari]|uniref:Uncharacterized protein YtcA n=2 Tax=Acetobacter sacchari TaxID=2661687 RepID=A0ABS3M188_9PROT|nr:hypothetical protein [Acetobacter sacchari]